jgi:hypothetical protein
VAGYIRILLPAPMQDPASELRRIRLPRTRVNKPLSRDLFHRQFIAFCSNVRENGFRSQIEGKGRVLHSEAIGEFQSSDDVRTGFIFGNTFDRKEVRFSVVDGLAIFEGDIVLGTVEELTQQHAEGKEDAEHDDPVKSEVTLINPSGVGNEAIGITGSKYRWPRAVIPFGFASSFTGDRNFVYDALTHWAQNTVFSFVERNSRNEDHYPNYVMFERKEGCSSAVGMQGGTFSGSKKSRWPQSAVRVTRSTKSGTLSACGTNSPEKTGTLMSTFFGRISNQVKNTISTNTSPMARMSELTTMARSCIMVVLPLAGGNLTGVG